MKFASFLLLCCLFITCQSGVNEQVPKTETNQVEPISEQLITETSFAGISIGDKIADHTNHLEKDLLKNGEGEFTIYKIKNEGDGPYAYCLSDPNDSKTIGQIIVQTPKAKTDKGIHVGSTLEEIMAAHPNKIQVHGSEIEGRTHADHGSQLFYRLSVHHFSYIVDFDKIDKTAKVVEIVINRRSNNK